MSWEQRWHPLREEWVIVAAHRQQRPWTGNTVTAPAATAVAYDPTCYLCPGNARVSGAVNARYANTFVFDNDHPCVGADAPRDVPVPSSFYRTSPAVGVARVVCFSPRHDLTLAEMSPADVTGVIDTYAAETAALGARYRWVQAFENKGELMGCSNPHPHGQIWASDALPNETAAEDQHQRAYAAAHGTRLLADYARLEHARDERMVHQSTH